MMSEEYSVSFVYRVNATLEEVVQWANVADAKSRELLALETSVSGLSEEEVSDLVKFEGVFITKIPEQEEVIA